MHHFCTLFDYGYLTRGLAMYESLKAHCGDFMLYIFAFDDNSYNVLKKLELEKVEIISLAEFEDEELLKIKPSRSRGEYCWTTTSSTILYVLSNFRAEACTYLDSDLYFYSTPMQLLEEMAGDSVQITEHRYSPQYDQSQISGKYCVQFITFKNDQRGRKALEWWRNRCLEWCYAQVEEGKFGDQKYLDDWTDRFEGVNVLQHLGGGVAPWNVQQYNFATENGEIFGWDKKLAKKFRLVFFHFHDLKYFSNNIIQLTGLYKIDRQIIDLLYKPYLRHLELIGKKVVSIDSSFNPNGVTGSFPPKPSGKLSLIQAIKCYIIFSVKFLNKLFIKFALLKKINPFNLYESDFYT